MFQTENKRKLQRDDLIVRKIPVPDPEYAAEVKSTHPHLDSGLIPGFPTTILVCGPPGRGKTNLLVWMLKSPHFYNGFFHEIYGYGPTLKCDKLYRTIQLKPQNICDEPKEIIPNLEEKLKKQSKAVENDPKGAPRVLFLFEDMTSFFNKIQSQPAFHRAYTQIRHVKGVSITCVHKYHAFNRTPRICSQHIFIFQTNKADIKHVYDEFGPLMVDLEGFMDMVNYALQRTEETPKPFFYINDTAPDDKKYRKCFHEILKITPSTIDKDRVLQPKRKRKRKQTKSETDGSNQYVPSEEKRSRNGFGDGIEETGSDHPTNSWRKKS